MRNIDKKGFTIIELTIAISLLLIFVISFWVLTSQSFFLWKQSIFNTYTDIDFSMNWALRSWSAWYWESLVAKNGIRNNKNLLPEDYMIFFQKSSQNDLIGWVYYTLQTQTRQDASGNKYMRVINREEHNVKSPSIYLKRIVGKNLPTDIGTDLNYVAVSFRNPTWKQSFYINDNDFIKTGNQVLSDDTIHTIHEFPKKTPSNLYKIIELEYYWHDDKKKFTYIIYDDKKFYTDLVK